MRVMVHPRTTNPYQALLYSNLGQLGVEHQYVGELTGSQTLNLILLPFEVTIGKLRGFSCLHLHWVFRFSIPLLGGSSAIRRLMRWYFVGILTLCRTLGVAVVWTAHNVLPHTQVFDNDRLARRQLTVRCASVIAHNEATLQELTGMGCEIASSSVIRHGPYSQRFGCDGQRGVVAKSDHVRLVFFGSLLEYKGVQDLLDVLISYEFPSTLSCVIAGSCDNPELTGRIIDMARHCRIPLELRLEYLPDDDLNDLLASADVVVLPYRQVTTSGSVIMALGEGCPVIIPESPTLSDIPSTCAWRYDGSHSGLAEALLQAATTSTERLADMSVAAHAYVATLSWGDAARATRDVFHEAVASLEGKKVLPVSRTCRRARLRRLLTLGRGPRQQLRDG